MRENRYLVNILHMIVVGVLCLTGIVVRTMYPETVFPHISIPMLVLVSLIPMVLGYYLGSESENNWMISTLLAGFTVTVLPLLAGWEIGMPIWKLGLAGLMVFGVTDILYKSMKHRLTSGTCGWLAPLSNAAMLYLASQSLQGLI